MPVETARTCLRACALATLTTLGCTNGGAPLDQGPPGRRVEIRVAPLNLPGIGDACYDVVVHNAAGGAGEVVWMRGDHGAGAATVGDAQAEGALCAGQFGNGPGGDISFVGPCDAGNAPPHTHTVTLWVENLYDADAHQLTPSEWQNPCAPGTVGCSLEVGCAENADTSVAFNLTIMRSADQGFFDVAVVFDDIFCSAKLDCTYDDGQTPINLLFNWSGVRDQTAVIGFACTAGPGAVDQTTLHVSDVRVKCDLREDLRLSIAPATCLGNGTIYAAAAGLRILDAEGAQLATPELYLRSLVYAPTGDGNYTASEMPLPGDLPGYHPGTDPHGAAESVVVGSLWLADGEGAPRAIGMLGHFDAARGTTSLAHGVVEMRPLLMHFDNETEPVYDAALVNPTGVAISYPALTSGVRAGDGLAHCLVGAPDLDNRGEGRNVAWCPDWLSGGSLPVSEAGLVGAELRDTSGGTTAGCHVDIVDYEQACGSCSGGGNGVPRPFVCWDLGAWAPGTPITAVKLDADGFPPVPVAGDSLHPAASVVAMPDADTLVTSSKYYDTAGLSSFVTVWTRSGATWTPHALDYLGAPAAGTRRDEHFRFLQEDVLSIGTLAQFAADSTPTNHEIVLRKPAAGGWEDTLLRFGYWDDVATPLGDASGYIALGGGAPGFVYGVQLDALGLHHPYIATLPANPDDSGAVHPLAPTLLAMPEGLEEVFVSFDSYFHRANSAGSTGLVATFPPLDDLGAAGSIAWYVTYDGALVVHGPKTLFAPSGAELIPEALIYDERRGVLDLSSPDALQRAHGGPWSSLEGHAHMAPTCDALLGSTGFELGQETAHAFAPDAGTNAETLTGTELPAPAWLAQPYDPVGRQSVIFTHDSDNPGKYYGAVYGRLADGTWTGHGYVWQGPFDADPDIIAPPAGNFTMALVSTLIPSTDPEAPNAFGAVLEIAPRKILAGPPITHANVALMEVGADVTTPMVLPRPAHFDKLFLRLVDPVGGTLLASTYPGDMQSAIGLDRWSFWDVDLGTTNTKSPAYHPFTLQRWVAYRLRDWIAWPSLLGYAAGDMYDPIVLEAPTNQACDVLDIRGRDIVAQCWAKIADVDTSAYYVATLPETDPALPAAPVTFTALPAPDPSIFDPGGSGTRYQTPGSNIANFLGYSPSLRVIVAGYSYDHTLGIYGTEQPQTALVAWTNNGGGWEAHVLLPGTTAAGLQSVTLGQTSEFLVGQFASAGSSVVRGTVFRVPDEADFTADIATWETSVGVSYGGNSDGDFQAIGILAGSDIVYGQYLRNGIWTPIIASLVGSPATLYPVFLADPQFPEDPIAQASDIWLDVPFYRAPTMWVGPAYAVAQLTYGGHWGQLASWRATTAIGGFQYGSAHIMTVAAPAGTQFDGAVPERGLYQTGTWHHTELAPGGDAMLGQAMYHAIGAPMEYGAFTVLATSGGTSSATLAPVPAIFVAPGPVNGDLHLGLAGGKGNQWNADPNPDDGIYQYAIYYGDEGLDCDGAPCNKRYFNIALGFDPTTPGCYVYFDATASDGTTFENGRAPLDTTYPVIHYAVPLTTTTMGGDVVRWCFANPLNAPGSGVQAQYAPLYSYPNPRFQFCYEYGPDHILTNHCDGTQIYLE